MVMQTIPKKRCAIYTRKSVEEGLDQEFNSLDAQREAGEAYIACQKANGWVCLPTRYDDGGYSGGNMKRPALQQLLLVDRILIAILHQMHVSYLQNPDRLFQPSF